MRVPSLNKYRAAIEVLHRGRETLMKTLADEVLAQEEDFLEGGFLFNEFLEAQGTRLHFLSLLVSQLEQSADAEDELTAVNAPQPAKNVAPRKRKPRSKKVAQQASAEGKPGET